MVLLAPECCPSHHPKCPPFTFKHESITQNVQLTSTWLFRIAYNCYLDRRRRAAPETLPADTPQALDLPAPEQTDQAFRYQRLYQAMDRLSEKEKAVIALHYFEDRSVKEIARILQMPSGTVKYHLSTGRNHLKTLLQ